MSFLEPLRTNGRSRKTGDLRRDKGGNHHDGDGDSASIINDLNATAMVRDLR